MPLYFFNQAGAVYDPDVEGVELASLLEASIEAVKYAAETLRDRPEIIWLGDEFRVEVTDDKQLILFIFIAIGVDSPAVAQQQSRGVRSPKLDRESLRDGSNP